MARTYHAQIPACPTLFTPLQPHARELLRLSVSSWVGWMRDHVISLQEMVNHHDAAVVVAGASLTYAREVGFHDADTITSTTRSSLLKEGVLIRGRTLFATDNEPFAEVDILFRPVLIGDRTSAAARPGLLPPELCARFNDDEREPVTPGRAVPARVARVQDHGRLLATHESPMVHHRHGMDFADQWAFMESTAYVGASRETLASEPSACAVLRAGLSNAVRDYSLELTKPYFLLDRGTVQTRAYEHEDALHFIHRMVGATATDVHATVVETFALP